jgi:hypothetical protein
VEGKSSHVENILRKILPVPDASKWRLQSRKRKVERSKILTATPYKNKLQESKEDHQNRNEEAFKIQKKDWFYTAFNTWALYEWPYRRQHSKHFVQRMFRRRLDSVSVMWRIGSWGMCGCRKWCVIHVTYVKK